MPELNTELPTIDSTASVFVPIEGTKLHSTIPRGSAILGRQSELQALVTHERFSMPAINLFYCPERFSEAFGDDCANVYLRVKFQFPGIKTSTVSPSDVRKVGVWDMERRVLDVSDFELLAEWCSWELPINERELIYQPGH